MRLKENIPLPGMLNSIIEKGKFFFLKKADVSTVVGVMSGEALGRENDLLVKRFNSKGFMDFLFKKAFGSRAVRLWKINQRLYEKGLPVPVPVCYIEPTFRQRHSFFLSSVVENSINLSSLYNKGGSEPLKVAPLVAKTIARWHLAGAVHGDMKWPNIVLRKNGEEWEIFFVDLDQTKLYKKPKIKGMIKDLVRFYRYGLESDAKYWVDSFFMPEYMKSIPYDLKSLIDASRIEKESVREWHKKGQKRY